jgi:hypothetical protein
MKLSLFANFQIEINEKFTQPPAPHGARKQRGSCEPERWAIITERSMGVSPEKEDNMGKWIAGVAATVFGGVLVYWLTQGINSPPKPQPGPSPRPSITRGYLAVVKNSPIHKVGDLRGGDKICCSKSGAEFLRTLSPFSEFDLRVIPAPEMYPALQQGVCSAAFVFQQQDANKLLPVGITDIRLMPVYDQ